MAKLAANPSVNLTITLELTEPEARALDALAGYSADDFLKVFYKHLGEAYLGPYHNGVRTLFKAVREIVPVYLRRVDDARAAFYRPYQPIPVSDNPKQEQSCPAATTTSPSPPASSGASSSSEF